MCIAHVLAGIAWDPQIRGFLAVARRRRGPAGLRLPAARSPTSAPASASSIARQRLLRLAAPSWAHLVDLRHRRHARRGPHVGGQGGRLPGGTEAGSPLPTRGARDLDTSALPPPEELHELDERRPRRRCARRSSRPSAAGSSCPSRTPRFGEAKATVDEHFVDRARTRSSSIDGADDYVTVYSFERGGKDEPRRATRAGSTASRTSSRPPSGRSSTRRTTPSSRSSR